MTWVTALFEKRSPERLPHRCVYSVLHNEKTSYLFGDFQGPDVEKKRKERVYSYVAKKVFFWPI